MKTYLKISFFLLFLPALSVQAGFLEMPETEEVPTLEEETMLLDLDVPSVRERDPDPQGGPRLNVKEFRVQGIVEFPKLGITRAELIKRVENIRFDIMQEGEVLESGYTLNELGEISDLLGEIEEETEGEHVSPVEVQRLVFLIREQRRKRGITLGMIEAVADVITRFYRERGFILAKAYIPEQHVRDGVVTLTLLLGELGEVKVQNNKRYSNRMIERVFKPAMGEPVTAKDTEERLYLVNDLPGLGVRGYFEPGSQVGDTRLNVNVLNEDRFDFNVRADNHGTESGGKNRLYADMFFHNPTHTGDQLHIGVLGSFEPSNTLYGTFRYQTNIIHPRVQWSIGASSNEFTIDQTDEDLSSLDVGGKSRVVDTGFKYKLRRSRVSNHSVDLTFNRITSNAEYTANGRPAGEDLQVVKNTYVAYNFDVLNQRKRSLHQGNIRFTSSNFAEGISPGQAENPYLLNFDYSWLAFLKIPFTSVDTRLLFHSSGQYAGEALSSSMQFALGGPTVARGFAVNEFYADDAVYTGLDWYLPFPAPKNAQLFGKRLSDMFQTSIYVDGAYGVKQPFGADEDFDAIDASLSNFGVGLRFNVAGVRGNLIYSKPITKNISAGAADRNDDKSARVYFDIQYSF